ncbi:hypothetical protein ACHAWF_003826 [Thalassiosira exigua]
MADFRLIDPPSSRRKASKGPRRQRQGLPSASAAVRSWSAVGSRLHASGPFRVKACKYDDGGRNHLGEIDHYLFDQPDGYETTGKEEDYPQIYALQFFRHGDEDCLLTSSDSRIHLWRVLAGEGGVRSFAPYVSAQFHHLSDRDTYRFGGDRNPGNDLFVFDARYCDASGLFAAALSDGTCRISAVFDEGIDETDVGDGSACFAEVCVLSLPPSIANGKFMTSVSWDESGGRLATCLAGGRVVMWSLRTVPAPYDGGDEGATHVLQPFVVSVLEGGHDEGRPIFGAKYCAGEHQELVMTYGADGKVCVWDSYSVGDVRSTMCTLVSLHDYPIYVLDIASGGGAGARGKKTYMAVAGGGADGMYLGVPAYIYDIWEKYGVCLACPS